MLKKMNIYQKLAATTAGVTIASVAIATTVGDGEAPAFGDRAIALYPAYACTQSITRLELSDSIEKTGKMPVPQEADGFAGWVSHLPFKQVDEVKFTDDTDKTFAILVLQSFRLVQLLNSDDTSFGNQALKDAYVAKSLRVIVTTSLQFVDAYENEFSLRIPTEELIVITLLMGLLTIVVLVLVAALLIVVLAALIAALSAVLFPSQNPILL